MSILCNFTTLLKFFQEAPWPLSSSPSSNASAPRCAPSAPITCRRGTPSSGASCRLRARAGGLAVHFPAVVDAPYFAECFAQGVEDRHASEAAALTELVLAGRPELLESTLADALRMARALDGLWDALEDVLDDGNTV